MNWIKLVPDREEHKTNTAEDAWSADNYKTDKKFKTALEAQLWALDKVTYQDWWYAMRGPKFCKLNPRVIFKDLKDEGGCDGAAGIYYGQGLIALDPKHSNMFILTHELAHMAGYDLHDKDFREAHLKIIQNVFEEPIYKSLEKCYNFYITRKETT